MLPRARGSDVVEQTGSLERAPARFSAALHQIWRSQNKNLIFSSNNVKATHSIPVLFVDAVAKFSAMASRTSNTLNTFYTNQNKIKYDDESSRKTKRR
jgi:hypothetical protein